MQSSVPGHASPTPPLAVQTPGQVLLLDLHMLVTPVLAHSKLELQAPPTAAVPPQIFPHAESSTLMFE